MNEMDKIQMDKLEEYVKDYKLFIDTCSLMFEEGADLFWEHILPLLRKYNKKINLPKKCLVELKKHSTSDDPTKARKAQKALKAVSEYQKYISVKEDSWEAPGTFADNVFLTVFNMYRTRYNLLLITQDTSLSKDILDLNNQNAVNGKRCLAKRINKYGFLNHYDWEEAKGDEHPATSQKQTGGFSRPLVASEEKFRICTTVSKIPADPIHLSCVPNTGDTVYDKNGHEVHLGDEIASGGEGTVYKTNTRFVAKIYHDRKLTRRKYEKLTRLLEKQLKCEGICFPVSGLYNRKKEFVGYLMPMAKGKELQRSIFIKPSFSKLFPDWKKKDLVELCITILEKMQYLHDRNIIMGDINAGNILVFSPTEVYFVDTDSYQIEDLPCPVGVDKFTPPELQGKPYNSFLRTMGHENFAVATLMFMLMLPGKSPYAQLGGEDMVTNIKNMEFPYPCGERSNKKTPAGSWGYIWSHLTYKLKEAFYETFQKGGKYSTEKTRLPVSEWIQLFRQYYHELTDPNGYMLKNDPMSGELFPTRLKNSNATNVTDQSKQTSRKMSARPTPKTAAPKTAAPKTAAPKPRKPKPRKQTPESTYYPVRSTSALSVPQAERQQLIMQSNGNSAPQANAAFLLPHRTVRFRTIAVITLIAAVIVGIICLIVFAKQIQWYQWQHMIGSFGGLLVCGVAFLLVFAIGWILKKIKTDFNGYPMTIYHLIAWLALIVISLLVIANLVLTVTFGEAYVIIFYWLNGYLLLASLIAMIVNLCNHDKKGGIFGLVDVGVIAVMITTQVLIQVL